MRFDLQAILLGGAAAFSVVTGTDAVGATARAEAPAGRVLTAADYDRATRFLAQNADKYVLNGQVTPHWLDGDRFWYRRQTGEGRALFVLVDAGSGARTPAFDHAVVAAGLSAGLGKPVEADKLPFKVFRYGAGGAVEAVIDDTLWRCETTSASCARSPAPTPIVDEIASPDGRWIAFVKDHNLWIKPAAGGEAIALTTDGVPDYGWALQGGGDYMAAFARLDGKPYPPALLWSPDSRRILTQRLDDRRVRQMGLMQSVPEDGSVRPRLRSWRFALPGDADLPMMQPYVFDIATRTAVKIDVPAIPYDMFTPVESREAWWTGDGKTIGLLWRDRSYKTLKLYAVDPATGAARERVADAARTFIEPAGVGRRPMVEMLENGDVLWFSERDGHGRLYLYGPDGQVKRVLATGSGQVTSIVHLDQARGQVWVRANGREAGTDPYRTSLYRIDMKTGATVRLTPEDGDHAAGAMDSLAMTPPADPIVGPGTTTSFSPSGRFFVDTWSTVNTPPVTVLRRADGRLVTTLERADIAPLKAIGFTPPEPFTATAADGKTTLYGVILRPSTFDPAKRYPVIDQIYPGPQARRTPNGFMDAVFDRIFASSMAELGFVVVLVDGRGTPGRDKAFLEASYGKLSNGGFLEDHVAAIKELGASRPWMDVDKVGIYGISGGGNATARAMFAFPDFYRVGVAHAGNHDQRGYGWGWGAMYNGPDDGQNYLATANAALAKNLKGKLLLMHGDMDGNVSPALTMQVVDALIKANKDFDMLVLPNVGHAWTDYSTRVTWDYMVRNLMGATPPKEYVMPKVEE